MGQEEIIARRYADGLAQRAVETDEVGAVRRDLRLLADTVNPHSGQYVAELANFLASPRVGTKDKIAAAGSVTDRLGVCRTAGDFFKLLVDKGRAGALPRIAERFDDVAGELTGERSGVVETARALSPEQVERLERALAGAFGGPVRLRQRIDPGLIAGAKVTVGDNTVDGSVLGRWRRLRETLAGGAEEECARACDARSHNGTGNTVDENKGELA